MRTTSHTSLIAVATLLSSAVACADEAGWFPEHPGDFAVRFVQYDMSLSDKEDRLDSTVKQISFGFNEAFGDRVKAGLFGGYSYLSQDDNPATEGEQLDGWHAGIAFEVAAYRTERFGLIAGARYMYQRVDEDSLPSPVEFTWYETSVYVSANTRIASGLVLFGGINHASIDGEERIDGTVRSTTNFDNSGAGAFIGLDFEIEPRGHIGIMAETGLRNGGQIYFLHRY